MPMKQSSSAQIPVVQAIGNDGEVWTMADIWHQWKWLQRQSLSSVILVKRNLCPPPEEGKCLWNFNATDLIAMKYEIIHLYSLHLSLSYAQVSRNQGYGLPWVAAIDLSWEYPYGESSKKVHFPR